MNRQFLWLILATGLVTGLGLAFFVIKPEAKARISVRDDDGPVAGARVFAFGYLKWENGNGLTDQSGMASLRFQSFSGIFEYEAEMPGYYPSGYPRKIAQFLERRLFSWSPWPTNLEMVIRKIGNPMPMYAKDACARMDVFGQPRGYDLIVGDWVAPHGVGRTNDFIFEIRREVREGRTNESLHLTFSNPGDGIKPYFVPGSGKPKLTMPALAPLEGYRDHWKSGDGRAVDGNKPAQQIEPYSEFNYYFRVRTQTAADGSVSGGFYGKIYNGILFETGPNLDKRRLCSPGIYFTYYLNPDGTRNTEYSGQNLLQGEGTAVRHP